MQMLLGERATHNSSRERARRDPITKLICILNLLIVHREKTNECQQLNIFAMRFLAVILGEKVAFK